MLTVSLHGIKIHAPIGLYPEEKIVGNNFEINVDMWLPDEQPWPFADYTMIQKTVAQIFQQPAELLETVVFNVHSSLKVVFPFAEKVKVCVRKLNPPMEAEVAYSQVCYEK